MHPAKQPTTHRPRNLIQHLITHGAGELPPPHVPLRFSNERRQGVICVFAAVLLVVVFGFIAFAVDTNSIVLTRTSMQNAADAAALAAAQELAAAVEQMADGGSVSQAVNNAREMALQVAAKNSSYLDQSHDIQFGKRSYDEASQTWNIEWGVEPYNTVKVIVRRDNEDLTKPDGKLRLSFGWALGMPTADVKATAIGFVEARDIAMVLDYSGSMNYDSQFRADTVAKLGKAAIEANLQDIWSDLGSPTYGNLQFEPNYATVTKAPGAVTWPGTSIQVAFLQNVSNAKLEFLTGGSQTFAGGNSGQTQTYQGSGSYSGKIISRARLKVGTSWTVYDFYDSATIATALGLDNVPYPYPAGSWYNYIDYCRDASNTTSYYDAELENVGFRRKFGMKTLVEFWLKHYKKFNQTPDLWKTRHYPFHAVKEGATLFCNFLSNLDYGDHLGLVTYDTSSRIETLLNDNGMPIVNLGSQLLTPNHSDIDTIQRHKQAAHYASTTNIGGGLNDAIRLLREHGRYGARPTILLMTDGNANVREKGWSLPPGWNWDQITDYDGDGEANYTTSDANALYAIGKAKEAADQGITVHTLGVGASADRDLLRAIAFVGDGIFIDVPGGSSVSQMEQDVEDAFRQIASKLPPPKLVYDE
jgi:Flp pilus assembly protein TadG